MKVWKAIAIPGNEGEVYWFAYNTKTRKAVECDSMQSVAEVCRIGNALATSKG